MVTSTNTYRNATDSNANPNTMTSALQTMSKDDRINLERSR